MPRGSVKLGGDENGVTCAAEDNARSVWVLAGHFARYKAENRAVRITTPVADKIEADFSATPGHSTTNRQPETYPMRLVVHSAP